MEESVESPVFNNVNPQPAQDSFLFNRPGRRTWSRRLRIPRPTDRLGRKETREQEEARLSSRASSVRSPICLLYTSDAADDLLCVDLGGRRIIKKKTNK